MLRAELDADMDRRKLRDGRTARQAWIAEREHLRPLRSCAAARRLAPFSCSRRSAARAAQLLAPLSCSRRSAARAAQHLAPLNTSRRSTPRAGRQLAPTSTRS